MNKLLNYFLGITLLLALTSTSYAVQNSPFSIGVGGVYSHLSLGSDWGEFNIGDVNKGIHHDSKPGEDGLGGEVQLFYHPTNWLATGLSFEVQYFDTTKQSGWERNAHTHQQHYMAAFQLRLTPNSAYNFYIPFAFGVHETSLSFDFNPYSKFYDRSFAYYLGAGVEKSISERFSISFETRYNGNRFHDKKVLTRGEYAGDDIHIDRKLNYLSFLLHLNYYL